MPSGAFRPFFLLASAWAALAVPVWLAAYVHGYTLRGPLPALIWHGHEMVFGFGFAAVAGFLLTAIPNWTGRLPVRGMALAALVSLWLAGRIAMLVPEVALLDLAFGAALILVVARELIAGRNWRNLPMLAALALLFSGNVLVHLHALDIAYLAPDGIRLGIATLCMLIALVGGRIVPSFTRNWLAKARLAPPAPEGLLDRIALLVTLAALAAWVGGASFSSWLLLGAGLALAARLSRWRGLRTVREPLLFILHLGYGWLALGLILLGLDPGSSAALHALTVGAIGTMTLAVMTRASLGHSGRALVADGATLAIYLLVTLAALLRVAGPFAGAHAVLVTSLAGLAWSAAFATFALHYGTILIGARPRHEKTA
ncbi:MAG TPA: NnrS family protein [Burkholderiales bacterium]|nr:NnrS family protein [Burkholderiales bacterium]